MNEKTDTKNQNNNMTAQPKKLVQSTKKTIKDVGAKGGATMIGTAAGAVVGAAVGGATGAALSNKKTRQQMVKTISELSQKAANAADRLNENTDNIAQTARKTLDEVSAQTHKLEKKTQN
ncbi:MAG: hypothetical protein ACREHC_00140 [Candidatus Levyibacteriota bacterium]